MSAKVKSGHSGDTNSTEVTPLTGEAVSVAISSPLSRIEFLKSLTLEVFLFLYTFPYIIRSVCTQNLILDKLCLQKLNLSDEICKNLSANATYKNEVDAMGSNYNLYLNLILMAPAALLSMFVGPWSDKYGRKLPLIVAISGTLLEGIGLIMNSVYFEAPIEYMFVNPVFVGLTGGLIVVITIVYSCASEMTASNRRTIKYALLELSLALGIPLGTFAGGLIYDSYGYTPVFVTSVVGNICALLWVSFVIKETVIPVKKHRPITKILDFFSLENFKECIRTCLRKRENGKRCKIWLMMFSTCSIIVTYSAFVNIAYIYTKSRYDWDVLHYSNVSTIFSIVGMVVTIILVPLLIKFLKVDDYILGLLGTISMMGSDLCKAFAKEPWMYYIGGGIGLFSGLAPLSVRSSISKIIEKEELGKVFSILATFESLVPLASSAALTYTFSVTLDTFPGLAYALAGIFLLLPLYLFIWLLYEKRKHNYVLVSQENPTSFTENPSLQIK